MNIETIGKLWHRFWFEPQSPIPIAVARILFGLLIIQYGLLLAPELHGLLGPRGITPAIEHNSWWGTPAFSLLDYLPRTDASVDILFCLLMVSATWLTLGLWTRVSAFLVWMVMASFYARNPYVAGASDSILRMVAFLLMFSHAGDALNINTLFKWLKGNSFNAPPLGKPWVLRLIQIHFSLVWWIGFSRKLHGEEWINGTAIYYVTHFSELVRYPLPLLANDLLTSKLLTWSTLILEFSLAILIWVRELRIPIIVIGTCFCLCMDWALWVPQFEYVMIAGLITFIEPSMYTAIYNSIAKWVRQANREQQIK